jgi:hypothetical protein
MKLFSRLFLLVSLIGTTTGCSFNEITRGKLKKEANELISRSNIAVEQAKAELYRAKAIKPDIQAQIFIAENAMNLLLSRECGEIPRTTRGYVPWKANKN